MTLFLNKFFFKCLLICLASGLSRIDAMHIDKTPNGPKFLHVEQLLDKLRSTFFVPNDQEELVKLKSVLSQYHPNKDGNIVGRNLKKLKNAMKQALRHWDRKQLYYKMLYQLCKIIDQEYLLCNICLDGDKSTITISCVHDFCYDCLFDWYVRHEKENDCHACCPMCRTLIHENIIENIKHDERYNKTRLKVLNEQLAAINEELANRNYYESSDSESNWEPDWVSEDEPPASRCCSMHCNIF